MIKECITTLYTQHTFSTVFYFNGRAPTFDLYLQAVILSVNSDQASPRHTKLHAYRCFLPNLTGFTSFCCVRPKRHHHLTRADLTNTNLGQDFNSAIADCRLQGTATSPSSTTKILFSKIHILKVMLSIIN